MKRFYVFILAILFGLSLLKAQSSFLDPLGNFKANDLFVPAVFSVFDVHGNIVYAVDFDAVYSFDLETGELIQSFDRPLAYDAYEAFITISPDGSEAWIGFTTSGNTDDRIYVLNIASGEWEMKAILPANFDLEFFNGYILVSGLNSGNWGDPNCIFQLDLSGNNNHRKIIETGGSPAGFSVSNDGNLFYGTSFFSQANALYQWNNGDLENVLGNINADFLTIDNAMKLSDLPEACYDCETDEAGNVAFNFNNYSAEKVLAKWNGNAGVGFNFDTIAVATNPADWLTMIKSKGNFLNNNYGNHLFVGSFGRPVAELHTDYLPMLVAQVPNFSGSTLDDDFIYDLSPHFIDPDDNEEFVFEITGNSNVPVACVSINENNLLIDFIAQGQSNITMQAISGGQSVCASFVLGVYPIIEGDFEEAGFEDLSLAPNAYWNGSDLSGGFQSGPLNFPNDYNQSWASWSGWAYSNMADDSTAGYLNQYSAITAQGFNVAASEGTNYGVAYVPIDFMNNENIPIPVYFDDDEPHEVEGFYVTNSTYAALTMEYGDDFTEKFGGASGNDPDYFMLSVVGYANGTATGPVDFYLADFRFEDNTQDYIIKTWQWVGLSSLGELDSLKITLVSSDVGAYGMNTPGYFCIDQVYVHPGSISISEYMANDFLAVNVFPNPASDFLIVDSKTDQPSVISIFDFSGKKVFETQNYTSGEPIDLRLLTNGFYLVRVQNGNSLATRSIIKL